MRHERTEFSPTDFDAQCSVVWSFDPNYHVEKSPIEMTVPQLVERLGSVGNPLSASEVRRVLGWLYGRGRARVASVVDGEEVWRMSNPEEFLRR